MLLTYLCWVVARVRDINEPDQSSQPADDSFGRAKLWTDGQQPLRFAFGAVDTPTTTSAHAIPLLIASWKRASPVFSHRGGGVSQNDSVVLLLICFGNRLGRCEEGPVGAALRQSTCLVGMCSEGHPWNKSSLFFLPWRQAFRAKRDPLPANAIYGGKSVCVAGADTQRRRKSNKPTTERAPRHVTKPDVRGALVPSQANPTPPFHVCRSSAIALYWPSRRDPSWSPQ